MEKKKLRLTFTPTFELDVTDWFEGERLTVQERRKKLKEDFSDFSVFMQHAEYRNLLDVTVQVDVLPE